ncbi:MAG: DUF1292 domain-containing protein [Erysipelotrichales bacterium]|nr:MAG: DUF1292 domain-containing protein [Erysipelotrichales bacterium]
MEKKPADAVDIKVEDIPNEENQIIVTDENGVELTMEILFTFEDETQHKNYVLYYDPTDENGEVFASVYDEAGNLIQVTTEEEWAMIEEVFEAFNIEHVDEEETDDDDEATEA